MKLLDFVVSPYLIKKKEELGLVPSQVVCLIWDSFTGQDTAAVKSKLEELNIKDVGVPKNMTHLLQPLDLTTNGATKKIKNGSSVRTLLPVSHVLWKRIPILMSPQLTLI